MVGWMLRMYAFCAVLGFAVVASTLGASNVVHAQAATAPSPEELTEARRIFSVGIQHADRGEWEEAVVCFRQVLEVREAPPVFFNLGAALVALGEYPEAEPLLLRVVDDPSAEATLVERARASLATMAERGGRLTIRLVDAPPNTVVYVDREVLPAARVGVEIPISAGEHDLSIRQGSQEITRRSVRVTIGDHAEVVVPLGAGADTALAEHDAETTADAEARANATHLGTTHDRAELRRRRLRSPWLWSGVGVGVVAIVTVILVVTHDPGVSDPVQGNSNDPTLLRF